MYIKPYDELTIQDNFIFQKVMRNKRICKQTIERLLDIDIKDISYPEEEKSINVRLDSKSIRLDVYVNDDKGTVFNIEMQTTKDMDELVKRARYYQGLIDIDNIEKGQNYSALHDTYIIFICTFGVFTGKRHKAGGDSAVNFTDAMSQPDGNAVVHSDGSVDLTDANMQYAGHITSGGQILNSLNLPDGRIDGTTIFDAQGQLAYTIEGDAIYDKVHQIAYTIREGNIFDKMNQLVGKIS